MPYRTVTKPIPFPRAFGATSDAAILSQAAILLLMEPALRRDRARLAEHQSARRTLQSALYLRKRPASQGRRG